MSPSIPASVRLGILYVVGYRAGSMSFGVIGFLSEAKAWPHTRSDYFGDTSKVPAAIRKRHGLNDGENWDETMFNVSRLSASSIRRRRECALGPARHDPRGARGQFMPKLAY